jgi:hypothetical protein
MEKGLLKVLNNQTQILISDHVAQESCARSAAFYFFSLQLFLFAGKSANHDHPVSHACDGPVITH